MRTPRTADFTWGALCAWRAAQLSRAATKKTWPTLLGCAENVWPCSRLGRSTLAPRMTAVAIVSPSEKAIPEGFMPCGGCRQVLVEAERRQDQPLRILLQVRDEDVMISASAVNLMPFAFEALGLGPDVVGI